MPAIDFNHLSVQERLDLIGDLCESLETASLPVTAAQKAELDHRMARLEDDLASARDAKDILKDLRDRHG
jgi:putative addiction module component (TIGR02574 family)